MNAKILPKHDEEELLYRVALSFLPKIGGKTAAKLLAVFGNAKTLFHTPIHTLQQIEGIGAIRAKVFKDRRFLQAAEKELEFVQRKNIQVLIPEDKQYPYRLKECPDAPIVLYYNGSVELNSRVTVAVIGTRMHTEYGYKLTQELIAGLSAIPGIQIISGLAQGIDTIAHEAALRFELPTIGVLAHGLDTIYPFTNKGLASSMLSCGGLLTEFPSGTMPDKPNFPVRNRIVAGMSDVTVVVESDVKGGAMITAYLACNYNREVAAFPGRVTDSKSKGPNKLIQKQIAHLITSSKDLIQLMNWESSALPKPVKQPALPLLNKEEAQVLKFIHDNGPAHTDILLQHTGFNAAMLSGILLQLEIEGHILSLPGKMYKTTS